MRAALPVLLITALLPAPAQAQAGAKAKPKDQDKAGAASTSPQAQAIARKEFWVLGAPVRGHQNAVTSACYSADGETVLSAGWDGCVKLWAAETGQLRTTLRYDARIHFADFFANDRQVVTLGSDSRIRLWDIAKSKELATIDGLPANLENTLGVPMVRLTPDGKQLWMVDTSPEIWCILRFDLGARKALEPLAIPGGNTGTFDISPDGRYVAAVQYGDSMFENFVTVWDQQEGKALFRTAVKISTRIRFTPEGDRFWLLSGTFDLRDSRSGEVVESLEGLQLDSVRGVATSPGGRSLFIGSFLDNQLFALDTTTKERLFGYAEFRGSVNCLDLSKDGATLLAGSADGTLRFFDAKTGTEKLLTAGHQNQVLTVAFAADGRSLVSGTYDNEAAVWDLATGKVRACHRAHAYSVHGGGIRGDAAAVTASYDTTIKVMDTAGKVTQSIDTTEHGDGLNRFLVAPDGKLAASAHYAGEEERTGKLVLWDLTAGKALSGLDVPAPIHCLAFCAGGKRIALWTGGRAQIYSCAGDGTAKLETSFQEQESAATSIALIGEGTVVTGDENGELTLLVAGKEAATKTLMAGGEDSPVTGLSVTPDGKWLFASVPDALVVIEVAGFTVKRRTTDFDAGILAIAVSGDGKMLATGMSDGTILVWDPAKLRR